MTSEDPMSLAFVSVLEQARSSYEKFVKSTSLPFVESIAEMLVVNNPDNNGWHTESREVQESTARRIMHRWRELDQKTRDDCFDLSADIIASHSTNLPFWSGGFGGYAESLLDLPPEQIDYNGEPNIWVARYIVVPAIVEYIRSLPSAEAPDSELANRIVLEALNLASANHIKVTSYLPVVGIQGEQDELESGDITVRKLTPAERGRWLENLYPSVVQSNFEKFPFANLSFISLPTHMIEVAVKSRRMDQPNPGSFHKSALCAFFLHGYPLAGPGRMTYYTSPRWMSSFGPMGTPIQLCPSPYGNKELTGESLDEIAQTFNKLRGYNLDQPANSRDLALHRFLLGSTRESPVDALLDYAIALECFLLPYDPATRHSDLSYRFRLNGAHYVGTSAQDRKIIWKQLKDLYDLRSRLVHGSQYPAQTEIETSRNTVRDLSTKAFLKAVSSHFPRVEEFNSWALQ
jgi:hypothetical protein